MVTNNYAPAEYGGYVSGVESGGGGGGVGEVIFEDGHLNKSYNELKEMFNNGIVHYILTDYDSDNHAYHYTNYILYYLAESENDYVAIFGTISEDGYFTAYFVSPDPDSNMFLD